MATGTTDRTATLDAQYHQEGCPSPAGRVEQFESVRPGKPDESRPPAVMRVTRCIQCGGQHEETIKET